METSVIQPLHQLQLHMLALVGDSPGLTQRDIAGETGVSQQLASYHLAYPRGAEQPQIALVGPASSGITRYS